MLKKLQSHVESEETRWESQLRQKESEVASLRIELNELTKKLNINEKVDFKCLYKNSKLTSLKLHENSLCYVCIVTSEDNRVGNQVTRY